MFGPKGTQHAWADLHFILLDRILRYPFGFLAVKGGVVAINLIIFTAPCSGPTTTAMLVIGYLGAM
jgi:hypothetical protein